MLDSKGNLLTSSKAIEKRAFDVSKERLESNKMKDHLKNLEIDTNEMCQLRRDFKSRSQETLNDMPINIRGGGTDIPKPC